jgi:flagellar basal body L-ring protein FlgH
MRLFISTAAAFALCVCALAACSPQDGSAPAAAKSAPAANAGAPATNASAPAQTAKQTPAQNPGETRRISIEESQKAAAAGEAIIVDVRDEGAYKTSHIKGAKSMPLPRFDERIGELPKDKLIITYCA